MSIFALRVLDSLPGAVRKVAILEVDGRSLLESFEKQMIKSGNKKAFDKITTVFEDLMMGDRLPPNLVKEIKGRDSDDDWREFELRHKRLRVYYFIVPPDNNVIVLGEFKKDNKSQAKTIKSFQLLKQEFKHSYLDNKVKFEEE